MKFKYDETRTARNICIICMTILLQYITQFMILPELLPSWYTAVITSAALFLITALICTCAGFILTDTEQLNWWYLLDIFYAFLVYFSRGHHFTALQSIGITAAVALIQTLTQLMSIIINEVWADFEHRKQLASQ